MDDKTILGATLGQLGSIVKKTGQQIVKIPEEMGKDLGGQVGGKKPQETLENKPQKQWQSDEERMKFLRDLYGSSGKTSSAEPSPKSSASAASDAASADKPEEQKELMELRNQLHKENYYDPTFNRLQQQEERASEKVENEKKQEMVELQQKEEKKPPPLAVQRAAQRVENIPGAG